MRTLFVCLLAGAVLLTPALRAQKWEFGGSAGYNFATTKTLTNGSLTADAGLDKGPVFGAFLVQNMYERVSGEIRYSYLQNDLKLGSVTFGANSHAIHYDFQVHATRREAAVRPYVFAGAGVIAYRGSGEERAAQPLSRLALLTATTDTKPLVSLGGGIKFNFGGHVSVRAEVRDYLSPFPKKLIFPNTGTTGASGWVQSIIPNVSIAYTF